MIMATEWRERTNTSKNLGRISVLRMVMPTECRGRTNITKILVGMSVLRMVMPTEWRERTSITAKRNGGSIEPVRMQKVKQMGKKRTKDTVAVAKMSDS